MSSTKLKLQILARKYGVCRLEKDKLIPSWAKQGDFFSITNTNDELSIVCSENYIPKGVTVEKEWRIIKIVGPLDFSMVGILSSLTNLLAKAKISVFAISTFDTDYLLVKDNNLQKAIMVLGKKCDVKD